jgi:uncharacterized protein
MGKKIFINLPVSDLKKSMEFYSKIGFTNNPAFTDETAACMILTEEIYVMLLTHAKLSQFTSKTIIDAKKNIGAINCISMDSLEDMNKMAVRRLIMASCSNVVLKTPMVIIGKCCTWI